MTERSSLSSILACTAIIAGTVLGLSAIDLVLPSVPSMPEIFGTSQASVQLVLASFVAGTTVGLLLFGSLASHIGRRRLFIASLLAFGVLSLAAMLSGDIWTLILIRFLQGAAASGPAVLAPGLIRALFSELGAMRAISFMGSVEALVPGLAPIAGAFLHSSFGWTASFAVTGVLCLMIGLIVMSVPTLIPSIGRKGSGTPSSYLKVLRNLTFVRYGMSHALILGGLLVFVFTAPAVIIQTMGGSIEDFILMQFTGVCCFILSANANGYLVKYFGTEIVVTSGTVIALLGAAALLLYALYGPNDSSHLAGIFWLLNTGLGVRGGPGFVKALSATHGDDERGSALIILATTGIAAIGTALVAPLIDEGLPALTVAVLIIIFPAIVLIGAIKPMKDTVERHPNPVQEE